MFSIVNSFGSEQAICFCFFSKRGRGFMIWLLVVSYTELLTVKLSAVWFLAASNFLSSLFLNLPLLVRPLIDSINDFSFVGIDFSLIIFYPVHFVYASFLSSLTPRKLKSSYFSNLFPSTLVLGSFKFTCSLKSGSYTI